MPRVRRFPFTNRPTPENVDSPRFPNLFNILFLRERWLEPCLWHPSRFLEGRRSRIGVAGNPLQVENPEARDAGLSARAVSTSDGRVASHDDRHVVGGAALEREIDERAAFGLGRQARRGLKRSLRLSPLRGVRRTQKQGVTGVELHSMHVDVRQGRPAADDVREHVRSRWVAASSRVMTPESTSICTRVDRA